MTPKEGCRRCNAREEELTALRKILDAVRACLNEEPPRPFLVAGKHGSYVLDPNEVTP